MSDATPRPRRLSLTRHDPAALQFAREAKGWTRTELANAVGCSPSLISEMEKGTRGATPARMLQIAAILNCPVSMLERKPAAVA